MPLEGFLGDYRFLNQKIETLIEISREYGFLHGGIQPIFRSDEHWYSRLTAKEVSR